MSTSFTRRQFLTLSLTSLATLAIPPRRTQATTREPLAPVFHAQPATPRVALTFDDGLVNVAWLLDECRQANLRLTLFPVGTAIQAQPALWQRAVAEGHEIGCHTYSHQPLAGQPYAVVAQEIKLFQQVTRDYLGDPAIRWFRPPYGSGWNEKALKDAVHDAGMTVVMWNRVCPRAATPGATLTARDVLTAFQQQARSGDIFLYHFRYQEVGALAVIAALCREWGWQIGTLSDLLGLNRAGLL